MTQYFDRYVTHILQDIRQDPALSERLTQDDAEIVRQALSGQSFRDIAQTRQIPEVDVWEVLGNAARNATELRQDTRKTKAVVH